MRGRLVRINTVLNAMPTYIMSLFSVPLNAAKRIDALRRNFLWQGTDDKKRTHLVKWSTLTTTKKEGGIRIENLRVKNKSSMMGWLTFVAEDGSLWKDVIKEKYGIEGQWTTNSVSGPYKLSLEVDQKSLVEIHEQVQLQSRKWNEYTFLGR